MPLVAHTNLPTFTRLEEEGHEVLSCDRASHQDIRELHIGLLNMMPDAALAATERQFFRLVGRSNLIAQFHMHPFTLDTLPRGEKASRHIADFYETFDDIRLLPLCGHHDNGDRSGFFLCPQQTTYLDSVDTGQQDIQKDQIGRFFFDLSNNPVAVVLGSGPKSGLLQIIAQQACNFFFVFDNKNVFGAHG